MKKIMRISMIIPLVILCACGNKEEKNTESITTTVATTEEITTEEITTEEVTTEEPNVKAEDIIATITRENVEMDIPVMDGYSLEKRADDSWVDFVGNDEYISIFLTSKYTEDNEEGIADIVPEITLLENGKVKNKEGDEVSYYKYNYVFKDYYGDSSNDYQSIYIKCFKMMDDDTVLEFNYSRVFSIDATYTDYDYDINEYLDYTCNEYYNVRISE